MNFVLISINSKVSKASVKPCTPQVQETGKDEHEDICVDCDQTCFWQQRFQYLLEANNLLAMYARQTYCRNTHH